MKVILLERVRNVGNLGDVAQVRGGYARNYLFPQGKAERATSRAVADFEQRRGELEERQDRRLGTAQLAAEALDGYLLQMTARASADGGLYGSITPAGVAAALNAQKIVDIDLRRGNISLPDGNLKQTGNHAAAIILDHGARAKITVAVLSEDGAAMQGETARKGD